jgi:DNA topoisomerase I
VLSIGLNRAVVLLAETPAERRQSPQVLRELGKHPDGGNVALCRGRYGPYVSHAGVFASLPRSADPDAFSLEQALQLLAAQKKKGNGRRRKSAKARAREPVKTGTRKRGPAADTKATARKPRSRPSAPPS